MASPTFRSASTAQGDTGSSAVFNKPAGAAVDDLLVAVLSYGTADVTLTLPDGFTILAGPAAHPGGGRRVVAYKRATNSEPTTYTFTTGSAVDVAGALIAYQGAGDPTIWGSATGGSTTATAPSVTTPAPNATILVAFSGLSVPTGPSINTPAGVTRRAGVEGSSGVAYGIEVGDFLQASQGATPTKAATLSYGGSYYGWGAFTVALIGNIAPAAPTLTAPAVGETVDRNSAQRFTWTFNDPDVGDSQSAYRARTRPAGTAEWVTDTGWQASPASHHDFPAGTFALGNFEWQAATKDAQGVEGPFSGSGFFTAGDAPPAPSITDPPNSGTIGTDPDTVTWSTPDQDAYQVQVRDGATVVHDTGAVESPTARQASLPFPDNNTARTIAVRVRDGGLWSEWASVTVTVSYSPPATPVLSVGPYRPGEVDGLRVQVTHPAPVGDQPAVTSHDVYVREVGDTGPGIRIGADLPATMAWEPGPGQPWLPASGVEYEFRVRAVASSGTTSWSAWTE